MRQTKTLLKIIQEIYKEHPHTGLCGMNSYCRNTKLITSKEYNLIDSVLQENRPKKNKYDPWWFAANGITRGKFLEKLITKYSKEKADGK